MMQSADPRQRYDLRARRRLAFDGPVHGGLLAETTVRPVLVMVGNVLAQHPTEMGFAEHDHVVE
jgi:hypothetical protein